MRVAPRAVLFDFDFTLADSSPGVVDCIQTAQAQMGLPVSTPAAIVPTIGLSVPDALVALCGAAARPRADEFARRFRARADEVMADHTIIYDTAGAVLAALRARGMATAIASTKFRYRIEALLERDGLRELVDVVVGAEDVTAHKPDPACLRLAVDRLGRTAAEALYVGDSPVDAEAAQRAMIAFVGVRTGTCGDAALAAHLPAAILDDIGALPGWLQPPTTAERDHG